MRASLGPRTANSHDAFHSHNKFDVFDPCGRAKICAQSDPTFDRETRVLPNTLLVPIHPTRSTLYT